MFRRSTQAFSLLEALCMIVTLFVFGWLCVGVLRHDFKHQDDDAKVHVKYNTGDDTDAKPHTEKSVTADPVKVDPKGKAEEVPWKGSLPAGTPAGKP